MSLKAKKRSVDSWKKIADNLSHMLADTYLIYVKTQNFHWNVEDPRFFSLHQLWEEQYKELAEANDELAERIRMIGFFAPATMKEFISWTSLKEPSKHLNGNEMLKDLIQDHEKIITSLREGIKFCQNLGDEGTTDLYIQRLRAHEKMAWFLRSHFA